MTTRLLIAEKEEAGRAMAQALGATEVHERIGEHRITYFRGGNVIIVPARGHLYEPIPKGIRRARLHELPLTDVEYKVRDKEAKARIQLIKELSREADEIVVATDWDREGESIGYNICYHALKLRSLDDFKRMYFNALAPSYIIEAYNNLKRMDESLLVKGLARGLADSIIGLNITKAITIRLKQLYPEVKQAFSLGRVQSPLLYYIYSSTAANISVEKDVQSYTWDSSEVYLVYKDTSVRVYGGFKPPVKVVRVERETVMRDQAKPLYNTDDVKAVVKELSPDETMQILEQLYLKRWLTYPRTKSRWAPREELEKVYNELVRYISLPPGYSIDNSPSPSMSGEGGKYGIFLLPDGIRAYFEGLMSTVERLVATFAPPLKVTKVKVRVVDGSGREDIITWSETIENIEESLGWESYKQHDIPCEGDELKVIVLPNKYREVYTRGVVKRVIRIFTDHDLERWMIDNGLGTEATRHEFPVILRERHYTTRANIPTMLGKKIAEIIGKIGLDPELTAKMEKQIEELESLSQLPDFKSWVTEITSELVGKIKGIPDDILKFKCLKGHELKLIQYGGKSGVIVGICEECGTRYPITR